LNVNDDFEKLLQMEVHDWGICSEIPTSGKITDGREKSDRAREKT